MTDITNTGAPAAAAPSEDDAAFDANFAAFMGHTWNDEPLEPAPADPAVGQPADAGEGTTSPPTALSTDASPAPAAQPDPQAAPANAETPAADGGAPSETPNPDPAAQVALDPADLAAMAGLITPPAQPAAETGAQPASSPEPEKDEDYAPFQPTFKLQPQMVEALFEADDVETRHDALVKLLCGFGNSITIAFDKRIKEHYAPKFREEAVNSVQSVQTARAIHDDFYGTHQDLVPYKEVVKKAWTIVASKNPGKPYDDEMRDATADLTRNFLRHTGIPLAAPAASAPPASPPAAPAPAPAKPKGAGNTFEAGAARPSGTGDPADRNSPAALFEDLSQF